MDNLIRFFTDRARRVLRFAHQEAERLHHSEIGTEHLLLGLLRESGGVAGDVLRDLGLQSGDVKHWVERLSTKQRRAFATGADPSLTPRTKRVLELARDEAQRRGDSRIDTHHILLGLVRQGDGTALEVLGHLGVTGEQISRFTKRALEQQPVFAGKRKHKPAQTKVVDQLAVDLTALAQQCKLDPVIGREREIERVWPGAKRTTRLS